MSVCRIKKDWDIYTGSSSSKQKVNTTECLCNYYFVIIVNSNLGVRNNKQPDIDIYPQPFYFQFGQYKLIVLQLFSLDHVSYAQLQGN